jgi:hypothetical protein
LNSSPLCSEKLCVLICDNSDQASQVDFNQFLNLSVRYFHNDSNIGLLGNLKRLIALSHADYIWILSDDDQVKVSELPVLIQELAIKRPDYCLLVDYLPDHAQTQIEFHWRSAIMLSRCLYKTATFKSLLQSHMSVENRTYPQVAIVLEAESRKLEFCALKNIYISDPNNSKSYSPMSAARVQIMDWQELEKQAENSDCSRKIRADISKIVSANIVSYSIQATFTFHKRSDFLNFYSKWAFTYRPTLSRIKSLFFSNLLFIFSFLDYRLARVTCLLIFYFRPGVKSVGIEKLNMRKYKSSLGTDASTRGYDSI